MYSMPPPVSRSCSAPGRAALWVGAFAASLANCGPLSISTSRSRGSFDATYGALLLEAWSLRHNLTVHDAVYVVLTRQLDDAVLVTADERLARAPDLGVEIIRPDEM